MQKISIWLAAILLLCPAALFAQAEEAGPQGFDELLAQKDGQEFQFQGKTYIWQDGVPFEKNEDGSLEPIAAPEGPGELYTEDDEFQWLTQGADGTIYINVAPRVWAQINFQYNSDKLLPDAKEVLDVFGRSLMSPGLIRHRLIVAGHTDSKGTPAYNLTLSRRRAMSVSRYLSEEHGVDSKRLILTGYGDSRPIADNETEEGRTKNRRVEFILLGPPPKPEEVYEDDGDADYSPGY